MPADQQRIDGFEPTVTAFNRAYLCALDINGTDWTQGWTYGLHQGSRAQPLWFE
ncbi:hypothetical protein [Microbulbifer epialgicus]|uniref:Uncharacterized protein n=1 Tax=Microbulbifer epialgicus TaxID=393907 RepID=A0ABV4P1Z6_9GAMM